MIYTATITSQGQITIPAEIRRKLKLDKGQKINLILEDDRLYFEPVPDLLELGGSLHKYAIKNKSIEDIMRLEDKAIEEGWTERYERFIKKNRNK